MGAEGGWNKLSQTNKKFVQNIFSNRLYMFSISDQQVRNITCTPVNAEQGTCRSFVTSLSANYFYITLYK